MQPEERYSVTFHSCCEYSPHLNCNNAVQGAISFHAGDCRRYKREPLTFLLLLLWHNTPSHRLRGSSIHGHCIFGRTTRLTSANRETVQELYIIVLKMYLRRHPSSATRRRLFMLDGRVVLSAEQKVQEEAQAFIANQRGNKFAQLS